MSACRSCRCFFAFSYLAPLRAPPRRLGRYTHCRWLWRHYLTGVDLARYVIGPDPVGMNARTQGGVSYACARRLPITAGLMGTAMDRQSCLSVLLLVCRLISYTMPDMPPLPADCLLAYRRCFYTRGYWREKCMHGRLHSCAGVCRFNRRVSNQPVDIVRQAITLHYRYRLGAGTMWPCFDMYKIHSSYVHIIARVDVHLEG